eukprot:2179043-Alexandrium_andersonii.AAC.1
MRTGRAFSECCAVALGTNTRPLESSRVASAPRNSRRGQCRITPPRQEAAKSQGGLARRPAVC